MAQYGYTLFCEGNDPRDLIEQSVLAEDAGFEFIVISDHFHPWLPEQRHSGFAWTILGAIAQATKRIQLATMVTCPIIRYHPVVVAQMAATLAVISNGRFTLGLGAGERLNEHVVGRGWPAVTERHRMLVEAIDIIKQLWRGDYVNYDGDYYTVEDARVFDLPAQPIDVFVAASGSSSAKLAASTGGVCITEPDHKVVRTYMGAGGQAADTWGQAILSWDHDEDRALATAHSQFRFSAGGWKVQAELPNPINFAAATKNVRSEDLAASIAVGPDPQRHQELLKKFTDVGVRRLAVAYPGGDHRGFMKFWTEKLKPNLV